MVGAGVTVGKGTVIRDSIIMRDCEIGENTVVEKAIVADGCKIGRDVHLGIGDYAPSKLNPKVYAFDLVTVGEGSVIPNGVRVGKNTAIAGETTAEDYPDGLLASGEYIIKEGDRT